MMNRINTRAVACMAFILSATTSCALHEASVDHVRGQSAIIPATVPMPVSTIEIYDPTLNRRVEADVLSLSSNDIRRRLTSTETLISVERRDSSGGFSYLGSGGKVSRGTYRVTFDYANYTNQRVTFINDESAIGRIGVGLRITADLEIKKNGVDLSGLIPIALAAEDNKVSGQLSFLVYGISNDKVGLAVPSQAILDVNSVQKSFEAAAAVRILFGLEDTLLEPYLLGISEVESTLADEALEAATKKLVH